MRMRQDTHMYEWRSEVFIGEIHESACYSTSRFDHDLVVVKVRPLRGILHKEAARLIRTTSGEQMATVVGSSYPSSAPDAITLWHPGDALVYLDDVTLEEVMGAHWLKQDRGDLPISVAVGNTAVSRKKDMR